MDLIILTEIARRSFAQLSRQQIYILYYIAGGLTAMMGGVALSGGAFATLIWNQFLRAKAPADLIDQVPDWVAPPPDSEAIAMRTFMHPDWLPAIGVCCSPRYFPACLVHPGYVLFRLLSMASSFLPVGPD